MLQPGDVIDIWVVEQPLGQGGMGSVYRCHNRAAGRILAAVKVLDPSLSRVETAKARFIREAEILFALDHPNIVKVRNVRMDRAMPYLEMEFIDGESLERSIAAGPMPLELALALFEQAADAVGYLHRLGIRHRDIKPSNLLLQEGNVLKLVDFGIATEQEGKAITEAGQAFGSVSYAPPEWIDPKVLDPRKWDIYALGVVFYEVLTGRLAFPVGGAGTSRQQALRVMMAKQAHQPLDPGPEFPLELRELVKQMTVSEPSQRPGEAEVVLERVRDIRNSQSQRLLADESGDRRYEILEVLGEGGFGTVYRARFIGERGFSKEVALKMLHPHMAKVEDVAQRLRDEARMLGLLRHRAIVQVDRLTRLAGRWTLVMEYVQGADLKEVLKSEGRIPPPAALEIVAEVAGALHNAYATTGPDGAPLCALHRDIKPSNIHLTPFGEVKVLDFGIGRANFAEREAQTQSLAFGSIGYMAPERLDLQDGPRSDVYSLGSVLVEMLTGKPIGQTSAIEKRHEPRLHKTLERVRALNLDDRLVELISDCMAWAPERRPDAHELERRCLELRAQLGGEPMRYWTERVVTPLLASRGAQVDEKEKEVTGSVLTGSVLAESGEAVAGESASVESSPGAAAAPLPPAVAPMSAAAAPLMPVLKPAELDRPPSSEEVADPRTNPTWYPGALGLDDEDADPPTSPTLVPDQGLLAELMGEQPEAARVPSPTEMLLDEPPAEPPQPERPSPPQQAERGSLAWIALAIALLLVGLVGWWLMRPPEVIAPTTRDVQVVVTGLSANVPMSLRVDGRAADSDEGQAWLFEGVDQGSRTLTALIGPSCDPDATPRPGWCASSSMVVDVQGGDGPLSVPWALSAPEPRQVTALAPDAKTVRKTRVRVDTSPFVILEKGQAQLGSLSPGPYLVQADVGRCDEASVGCWPDDECPRGCLSWVGQLQVDVGSGPVEWELPIQAGLVLLDPPTGRSGGVTRPPEPTRDPTPDISKAPPQQAAGGSGSPISGRQFGAWLKKNPEWQREQAIADGRADDGYLKGWDGPTPPAGQSAKAVVNVAWSAAEVFCRSRGGLATLDAAPTKWTESGTQPWHEYRQDNGRPAWRRSDAAKSTNVGRKETSAFTGFRCQR